MSTETKHTPGLVRVADLVGADISGVRADVRHRTSDGKLRYPHTAAEGARLRTLKAVRLKPRSADEVRRGIGSADWLYLEWQPVGDCGFSGTCGADQGDWYIEVVGEAP